jgi:hypothetical protein
MDMSFEDRPSSRSSMAPLIGGSGGGGNDEENQESRSPPTGASDRHKSGGAGSDALNPQEILQYIQKMEQELQKAKVLVDPASAGLLPSPPSETHPHPLQADQHQDPFLTETGSTISSINTPPTQQQQQQLGLQQQQGLQLPLQRFQSLHRASSSSSLQLDLARGEVRGNKATAARHAANKAVWANSPSRFNGSLNSTFNSTAFSLNNTLNTSTTSASSRSSPMAHNANLSIFKSPLSRKKPPSKNVFNDAKLTWTSTIPMKTSVKERFQSTNDLLIAKEVNPVFFSNDV